MRSPPFLSAPRTRGSVAPALAARVPAFAGMRKGSGIGFACLASVGLHALLLAALLLWFAPNAARRAMRPDSLGRSNWSWWSSKGPARRPRRPNRPASEPAPAAAAPQPMPPSPPPPADGDGRGGAAVAAATCRRRHRRRPTQRATPGPAAGANGRPEAPKINLGGTDSETNAIVTGPSVIPASVDAKFRNQEPVYPPEAVRRAEQGAVMLLIHVSPEGLADAAWMCCRVRAIVRWTGRRATR